MAAVLNLAALTEAHETVAGPAFPIARGTEGRNIPHLHQPAHHLVEASLVGNVKLLRIGRPDLLLITAYARSGSAADLGHTETDHLVPSPAGSPLWI